MSSKYDIFPEHSKRAWRESRIYDKSRKLVAYYANVPVCDYSLNSLNVHFREKREIKVNWIEFFWSNSPQIFFDGHNKINVKKKISHTVPIILFVKY